MRRGVFRRWDLVAIAAAMTACLSRPLEPQDTRTTKVVTERIRQSRVDKIDLLLMIDNSGSMADKQAILGLAVPDLVRGLADPPCVGAGGAIVSQPAGPLDPCPAGSKRDFPPVLDIHVGVVTSSLGGYGTTGICDSTPIDDDHGRLVARASGGGTVPTYQNLGFLAWDPAQKLMPAGEGSLGTLDGQPGLVPTLRDLVLGAGDTGCGFEAQLESWYRFLVEPKPYASVVVQNGSGAPMGVDDALLKERADFLRPDSLLAIVLLTDENDCSVDPYGYGVQMLRTSALPRARQICATNPNDPCCASCSASLPSCPPDPTCLDASGNVAVLSSGEDPFNLRCMDQKRRFGLSFLYPTDRYVRGLTSPTVSDAEGNVVPNPIFANSATTGALAGRDPSLVFLAGIVGVPWQDIARRDMSGKPDLSLGFQSAAELADPTVDVGGTKHSTWDVIVGDPAANVAPLDPLMRESRDPRSGTNPVTGDALAPPTALPDANPMNGHEWNNNVRHDDLMYACVFPLLAPAACAATDDTCDCSLANGDPNTTHSPLCQDPSGAYSTTQLRAKAYPGSRELAVLEGLGDQAIVASVCPAQLTDAARTDFGYRPAIAALIERLRVELKAECLPFSLKPDANDHVSCLVLEGKRSGCDCGAPARSPVDSLALSAALSDPISEQAGVGCFCAITQLSGADLDACENQPDPVVSASGAPVNGWCYIDATTAPPTGNPDLVADCAPTEKREIRFVGAGNPVNDTLVLITCAGE